LCKYDIENFKVKYKNRADNSVYILKYVDQPQGAVELVDTLNSETLHVDIDQFSRDYTKI
jgi:hypothetical protein